MIHFRNFCNFFYQLHNFHIILSFSKIIFHLIVIILVTQFVRVAQTMTKSQESTHVKYFFSKCIIFQKANIEKLRRSRTCITLGLWDEKSEQKILSTTTDDRPLIFFLHNLTLSSILYIFTKKRISNYIISGKIMYKGWIRKARVIFFFWIFILSLSHVFILDFHCCKKSPYYFVFVILIWGCCPFFIYNVISDMDFVSQKSVFL